AKGGAPSPAPSPAPTAPPSTAPSPAPSQAAGVKPQSIAVKVAVASPGPASTIVRLPADAVPKIVSVTISETTVHPGDRVVGNVVTSSNVASVEARIGGYGLRLEKTGVGRFAIAYRVLPMPWFLHGNYNLEVIARNPRGDAVARTIPLSVR
ncbi:MAG: hypothetical protein WA814_07905, partial [Candidatus Baltobacteraceae bacterium]